MGLLPLRRLSYTALAALLASVLLLAAVAAYTSHPAQSDETAASAAATGALSEVAAVQGKRRLLTRMLQSADQYGTRYTTRPTSYVRPVYGRPVTTTVVRPYTTTIVRPYPTTSYARPYGSSHGRPASSLARPAMKVASAALRPSRNNAGLAAGGAAAGAGALGAAGLAATASQPINKCQIVKDGLPYYNFGAPGCEPNPEP